MLAFVVAALEVSEKIKTLGAYAGFASVIGIGVLSVLYFGQARELKRLREWAGRAPERAAEMQERIAAEAVTRSGASRTVVATPARVSPATPVTPAAAASAAAAAPATAGAVAAVGGTGSPAAGTPAAATPGAATPPAATPGATTPAAAAPPAATTPPATDAPATPDPAPPASATPAAAPATGDATQVIPPATPVPSTPAAATPAPRPVPAVPLRSSAPPSTPASRRTAAAKAAPPPRAAEPSPARATMTVIGGVAAAAAVIALLVTQVFAGGDGGGDENPTTTAVTSAATTASTPTTSTTPKKPVLAPINRGSVSYAVLNATLTNQLARNVGNRLQASGYTKQIRIQQAKQSGKQTTIVAYAPNQKRAALDVARILGVSAANVVPVADDPTAAGEGAGADVVVVMGADKAQV